MKKSDILFCILAGGLVLFLVLLGTPRWGATPPVVPPQLMGDHRTVEDAFMARQIAIRAEQRNIELEVRLDMLENEIQALKGLKATQ